MTGSKSEEFDKAVTDEARNKQEQAKKDLYNLKLQEFQERVAREQRDFQKQMAEFMGKHVKTDDKGNTTGPWEISDKMASDASSEQTTAYNAEWKNAMLSLLGSFAKMAEAMNFSIETHTYGKKNVGNEISSAVSGYFNKPSQPDLKELGKAALPTLMHNVTLNVDGRLQVKLAKGDIPMEKEFTELFTGLVEHWMSENGYKPGTTPETKDQFFSEAGSRLTQTKMEELQEDHSLQSFLEENSSLTYQSSPSLS